jgi:hypothetical protein
VLQEKFGKLRIKKIQDMSDSNKKIEWVCDCGKEPIIRIYDVLSGKTRSCGRCSLVSADEISKKKFGKLLIKNPQNVMPGSAKKIQWICDCGKETTSSIRYVLSGNTKSCGRCNLISADEIIHRKFGKLKIKYLQDIKPGSQKKIDWICDCGRETTVKIAYIMRGEITSCGHCNEIPAKEIIKQKFGKLRIKTANNLLPGSMKKVEWVCDCGNNHVAIIKNVISGTTKSCGHCNESVQSWYQNKKKEIRSLQCPINRSEFTIGGVKPLEIVKNARDPFKAMCPACGSIYYPALFNIKRGISLTCGCSTNRVSFAQRQIKEFIESLGVDAELEYKIGTFTYDIFVPKYNTLIEYNGLKWHSYSESRKQDLQKYKNAISFGFSFICIFEDEWTFSKSKIESLLKNKFIQMNVSSLRPSKCEIRKINSNKADPFYAQYHYIGPVKAKINYGVYYEGKLIACMSFKRPTRQSFHDWELVRMASDPEFRIHGIWSKTLKQFISEYSPKSIVSFSDNRLFNGLVYQKIGFKFDGEIPPDYFWVKGQKRFHKSGLRKKGAEKTSRLTEYQLREAQGYLRIWDLGKKRWVLNTNTSH